MPAGIPKFECATCGHDSRHHDGTGKCTWRGCECVRPAVGLTRREFEVLKLLASGQGTKGAAQTLLLSVKTIEAHKQNLRAKTGMGSMLDVIMWALRCGVLTLEDLPARLATMKGPL